jgi:hypothetical protein
MPVVMVAGQAGSRVCDDTDPVPDVRPPGRVDGAAGTVGGVEGRRAAGAAPGDRGPAAPASSAEAGLGRPGGTRRPDAAAATAATDRHQRWHPRRQGTDIAASPFTARSSQATLGRQPHRIMAGYPVHRPANPWHGHRLLRRANVQPSATTGHSVHDADSARTMMSYL